MVGIAAGRGGNGIGIAGIAPDAEALPLRVDVLSGPISRYVDAMAYASDAGMVLKVHGSVIATPWLSAPIARTALRDTTLNLGFIHLMPVGNFDRTAQADEMLTSPHVITVGGFDFDSTNAEQKMRPSTAFGPNVFCAEMAGITRESMIFGDPPILRGPGTAESLAGGLGSGGRLSGPYTDGFQGTSASVAAVGGGLALLQEALVSRPQLFTTRFVKHLIARNSQVINTEDETNPHGGWIVNAAGLSFNNNYGFGAPIWWDVIRNSYLYDGVTAQISSLREDLTSRSIPEDAPLNTVFTPSALLPTEDVQVFVKTDHPRIGDLRVEVISPAGTTALLKPENASETQSGLSWNFLANTFWGENAGGEWTVRITDTVPGVTGAVQNVTLRVNQGQLINRPVTHQAEFLGQTLRQPQHCRAITEATVTMRNTGTSTWRATDNFYLVSQGPYGNNTWGRVNVTLAPGEQIAPGQSKKFRFNVVAPSTPGSYWFQWQMRKASAPQINFGEFSLGTFVTVRNGNDAEFVSQSVPALMISGRKYNARVVMRNVGTTTWNSTAPYYLVSQNPYANSTWGRVNVPLANTDSVATNQFKDFAFKVLAPNTRGYVNFQWQMRQGGRENFGDFTPNARVYVTPDEGTVVSETFTGDFFPNAIVTYAITIRNTGASTWTPGVFEVLNLITEAVTTWGWLTADLAPGSSVAPGQSGTFYATMRCPASAGDYDFHTGLRHGATNRVFAYGTARTIGVY
jgi:subtilisin-like proprotein convertase family protein